MILRKIFVVCLIALIPLPVLSTSVIIKPIEISPENAQQYSIKVFALLNEPGCNNGVVFWVRLPEAIEEARFSLLNQENLVLLSTSLEIREHSPEPALKKMQSTLEFLAQGFRGVVFCIESSQVSLAQIMLTDRGKNDLVTRAWELSSLQRWVN